MKVNSINQTLYSGIKIQSKDNTHCEYLYNKVLDIARDEKIGGVFATDYITLSTNKQSVIQKLKASSIKFMKY